VYTQYFHQGYKDVAVYPDFTNKKESMLSLEGFKVYQGGKILKRLLSHSVRNTKEAQSLYL
jgi:hypothetical protein